MFKRNAEKLSKNIADNVAHENVEGREIVAFPLEQVIRSGFGKQAKDMLEKFFHSALLGEDVVQQLFIDWNLPEDYDKLTFVVREKTEGNKSKIRTVKMEDRIKRLSLEDRLLPHYNITDKVELDSNGHSAYYSIDQLAREKLHQIIDESMSY